MSLKLMVEVVAFFLGHPVYYNTLLEDVLFDSSRQHVGPHRFIGNTHLCGIKLHPMLRIILFHAR